VHCARAQWAHKNVDALIWLVPRNRLFSTPLRTAPSLARQTVLLHTSSIINNMRHRARLKLYPSRVRRWHMLFNPNIFVFTFAAVRWASVTVLAYRS
jgi:hypothetical protein